MDQVNKNLVFSIVEAKCSLGLNVLSKSLIQWYKGWLVGCIGVLWLFNTF